MADKVASPAADYALEEGSKKVAGKTNAYIQVCLLGLVLFGCPGMFNAINGLGAGGQVDATAGSNANVALYATFASFSIVAGSVHNVLGPRLTLFLGGLPYALYVASFLNYNHTQNGTFVIVAGGILGIGAGLLWTAQGAIVLSYATENEKGKYISICWVIFNLGAVIGALVPFILNYNADSSSAVSDATYIVFLILMVCGAAMALFLKKPDSIIRSDNTQVDYPKSASVKDEIKCLYEAIFDWRMLCLIPASFASNFFYGYQFNAVNAHMFSLRTRGLNGVLYWGMQMVGAFIFGNYVMDKESVSRATRGKVGLAIATGLTFLAWILGVIVQKDYTRDDPKQNIDFTESSRAAFPMIVYMLYGLVDAVYQNYVYWVIGAMSNEPMDLARFVGLYKAFQSAGGAISWRIDVLEVSYMTQLIINWALMAISFPFMYLVVRKLSN
ncbi:hypothetical protein SDRG_12561 [Saprolegnia diclina VS20]|uniref:Major facilitator superfamily (MFS) profile domain-containing protein n=1 Tax=Saprolegnia diclina (strain VS20) TaxID=1156394 RepID=T0Q8I2_SAPDV|nr:hypothetical protein SDRG_12561 [Saprolegnia diclina VS20]EQC29790.1 hypothetical protein SDRG_12561 [Saprolegnia diclina VS20]|eukprot:XP_008616856.1 hypothetical protein SDRG_12561 [Saprolegnia diclina VS20]